MGSEGSFESIRALLSIAKLDVFSYKPDGKVVAIDETKPVAEAMATLRSNKVSSCAVINSAGEYVGAFSHGDLIRNVMKGLEAQLQKDTDATSPETQQEVQRLGESMLTTPVKSFMHAGDLWFVGGADSTVLDALDDMMQEARAHHRLFVCGSMDDARPTGVVSQSDIIQMVWEHRVELSATLQKTLEELNLCQGAAFTMPADTPTVRVLLNMFRDHKSSMGITDSAGDVLLGNLSQSDLCALKPDEFSRLLLPVGHFLCLARGLPSPEGGGQDWAAALKASPVVKVGKQSPLAEALEKLVVHHLHRLYVVDDSNHPLSIITLTDILRPVARSKA